MKTIVPIGELKTHCYQIIDNAVQQDNILIITKRGKAIATIYPIQKNIPKKVFFGAMSDIAQINTDIINSLDIEWDAENE